MTMIISREYSMRRKIIIKITLLGREKAEMSCMKAMSIEKYHEPMKANRNESRRKKTLQKYLRNVVKPPD